MQTGTVLSESCSSPKIPNTFFESRFLTQPTPEKDMYIRSALFIITVCTVLVSCAWTRESDTERRTFQLPEMAAMGLPFSDAVLVGNTLYLSGNGGIDLATMSVPDDPKEEAKLLMDNFGETLALADMSLDDLVSVTVYCPDLSLYSDFNEIYRSYFDDEFPARAFIGSGPLLFGLRFEMQAIAVK
jgi:enamine deaminase RidA (YjgF/YER057c/UK114 family)